MLGGRTGSREGRYAQAAGAYGFGSHCICLYLHPASSCTWGCSSPSGMDVLTSPKEMASRAAGLNARWMMGTRQSAPQLPAASSQQQSSQDLEAPFRPRRLEDRASTTATFSSIVHCHQPHSLVLSGKRATLGAWGISHTALQRKRSAHTKQRRKSYWNIQKRHEHTLRVRSDSLSVREI
jgi:hypothetical protein